MKIYAWQPRGHGQYSFFVMANGEEEARAAVEKEIADGRARYDDEADFSDGSQLSEYDVQGWGTEYYDMTVVEAGTVVLNGND